MEYWLIDGYRFIFYIVKMSFANKPFARYPKTHFSIFPTFQHSNQGEALRL
jgi:hypothetical protein